MNLKNVISLLEWVDRIDKWADEQGGIEVWASWLDTMRQQDRDVGSRTDWKTLSDKDKALDKLIAFDVVSNFITYAMTHTVEGDHV